MPPSPAAAPPRLSTCSEAGRQPSTPPRRWRRPTRADAQRAHHAAIDGGGLSLRLSRRKQHCAPLGVGDPTGRAAPRVGVAPSGPWYPVGVTSVLALTDYQWLGIGGMVSGLLLIFNCRRIADVYAAILRADADAKESV